MSSDSETPPRGRPRSGPPKPFVLGPASLMSLSTVSAVVIFAVSVTAIYLKMPSAEQIESIEANMQKQITANKTQIDRMSTQVGFLVRLEVAKAAGDPMQKMVVRKAARDARTAAEADALQPPQPASPDPLDGIRLE